jgi:hypothetical protein
MKIEIPVIKIGVFIDKDDDTYVTQIQSYSGSWMLMLFWPPAFSLFTNKFDASWNVFTKKFGHRLMIWKSIKAEMGKE